MTLLTGLLGLGVAATADASPDQRRHQQGDHKWAELDRNQDGKATLAEQKQLGAARFSALDTNKDARLTPAEFAVGPRGGAGQHAARFAQLDKNRDQRIARAEAAGRLLEHFDRLDSNKDGFITAQELSARHAARAGKGPGKRFEQLDGNKDGVVSRAEFEQHWTERFLRADSNRDAVVTRAEFDAALWQHARQRGHQKRSKHGRHL